MDNQKKKRKKRQGFDLPTLDWAVRTSSYCFKSSGGQKSSISAPSIEMGTLTPETNPKYWPVNYDTKLFYFFFFLAHVHLPGKKKKKIIESWFAI